MVPRVSAMDVRTQYGGIQLRELAGNIRVSSVDGPIALVRVGGIVDTTSTNGPLTLMGVSGNQRATATNGPVTVHLAGNHWDGPGLGLSATNGPVSLWIPDVYSSPVEVQTSQRSRVNCKAPVCAELTATSASPGLIRIGNGEPILRLSATNGSFSLLQGRN